MSDAQIHIEKYNVFRADRCCRERGGVLLYINEEITITTTKSYDDDICEVVFCLSPPLKLMLFCVYKPCDASSTSFSNMLDFITSCINETDHPYSHTILILGDFNFPELWTTNCEQVTGTSTSENNLLNFIDNHFLSQYVDIPTREENILDLCLTNNDRLIYNVKSEYTMLSDHNTVDIMLSAGELDFDKASGSSTPPLSGFPSLNLFDADFTAIHEEIRKIIINLIVPIY